MIEGMPWPIWLGISGTGWALTALLVTLVYRGRLVPRSTLEAQERAHMREMELVQHDANEWRAEGRIKDQTITEISGQNTILLREVAPSMNQLFEALRRVGAEARRDGTP